MPRQVTIGPEHGSGEVPVVRAEMGDEVVVDLGPGWSRPRLWPLGGDPGPVTRPLRPAPEAPEAPGGSHAYRLRLVAVSPGRARISATSDDGTVLDLTVMVLPRRGMSRHG